MRRRRAERRDVLPDPKFNNKLVTKFVNMLMEKGKKSTAVTVGYTLWRLANNPNTTILITNEKLDKSKSFLKEIKAHITTNPRFKLLFGEWSCENKPGKKWSETRIDILPRSVWSSAASVPRRGPAPTPRCPALPWRRCPTTPCGPSGAGRARTSRQ